MRWIRSLKLAFSSLYSALLGLPVAIFDGLVYCSRESLLIAVTVRCDDNQTENVYEPALRFVYEVVVHQHGRDTCIAKNCVEIQVHDEPDVQILQTHFEFAERSYGLAVSLSDSCSIALSSSASASNRFSCEFSISSSLSR